MLRIVKVTSSGEFEAARALAALVEAQWPGITNSQGDLVTIAAGIKSVRELDLLVTIELERPRAMPFGEVQAGVLVIESKRLDPSRLLAVGNDLRPVYRGTPKNETVLEQLKGQIDGLVSFLSRYGVERPFVHGLAWIRGATRAELTAAGNAPAPAILGSDATWGDLLAAAAAEHRAIAGPQPQAYRAQVAFVRERLTRERDLSPRDRAKLDRFTTEVLLRDVLDDVLANVGARQVRLIGRAGSGKSTTLALVAKRLAARDGARILFLTYHRVLRGELEHLVRELARASGLHDSALVVRTSNEFFVRALEELGERLQRDRDGQVVYADLPRVTRALLARRGIDEARADAATLRELDPERFAFDYEFVDEVQDWDDTQRDLLRLFFAPEQTVLCDGVDQFAQRQTRCDWMHGVPRERRYARELNRSLRMSVNVAHFVNAFAAAAGLHDWSLAPHPELVGGRVLLFTGAANLEPSIARALQLAREAGNADGDCLVIAPPRTPLAEIVTRCNAAVWDATDPALRDTPRQPNEVPIISYASARGMEGWAAALVGLDANYDNRLRHPNADPDASVRADDIALGATLQALTRAAHVLVVHVNDPAHPVARWLGAAAAACGTDVVERYDAS